MDKGTTITKRTATRQVLCGGVAIGGGAPVVIQSMTNTNTEDVAATAKQVARLAEAGADVVRVAVPSIEAAESIGAIKEWIASSRKGRAPRNDGVGKDSVSNDGVCVPIVADVHFDYKIAIKAIEAGADKVRINPGNIGGPDGLKAVCDAAGAAGIPMRIGVNGGSLQEDLRVLYKDRPAEALAESALRSIDFVRDTGFNDIVVSIKSSDVLVNTEAHRLLAAGTDCPLHIGITEAGFGSSAVVKSAAGIGALLAMGIGDTLRVSLTGDPLPEVTAARDILRSFSLLPGAITLISCPTCGRCHVELATICEEVSAALGETERVRFAAVKQGAQLRPITVAIMGCAVNGPGEASHADLGVACGVDNGVYFEHGVRGDSVPADRIVQTILERVAKLL